VRLLVGKVLPGGRIVLLRGIVQGGSASANHQAVVSLRCANEWKLRPLSRLDSTYPNGLSTFPFAPGTVRSSRMSKRRLLGKGVAGA
jgi:hypothetical protein